MGRRRLSRKKRIKVYNRDGEQCVYCRSSIPLDEYYEIDHKIPLSPDNPNVNPGTNDLDNLQLTCRSCNEDKGSSTDDEYRAKLQDIKRSRQVAEMRPPKPLDDYRKDFQRQRREQREQRQRRKCESTETIMSRPLEP